MRLHISRAGLRLGSLLPAVALLALALKQQPVELSRLAVRHLP